MKQRPLRRGLRCALFLAAALCSVSSALAGSSSESTKYAKLTATATSVTGEGKVYVSTKQETPAESAFAASSSATGSVTDKEKSANITFYLYATADPKGGDIEWQLNGTTVAEGNGAKYTINATSTTEGSPTSVSLSLFYKLIQYPYAETVNGVTYIYADNKVRYSVNADGTTATVANQESSAKLVGDLVIPATIQHPTTGATLTVTKMAKGAFKDCPEITSLVFEAAIDELTGNNVTANLNQYISGAPSLNQSGAGVFAGMSKLKKVDLSKCRFTATGGAMFAFCLALTEVKMPDTLEELTGADFLGTRDLRTLNLRNTKLKKIGSLTNGVPTNGVKSAEGLTDANGYYTAGIDRIFVPKTLTTIEQTAFHYSTRLQQITDLGVADDNYRYPTAEEVAAHPWLTAKTDLGNRNCYYVSQLSNVTSIGAYAFTRCENLGSILIPHVTSLGTDTFDFHAGWRCRTLLLADELTDLSPADALRDFALGNGHNDYPGGMTYRTAGTVLESASLLSYPHSVVFPPKLAKLGKIEEKDRNKHMCHMHIPATLGTYPRYAQVMHDYSTIDHMYVYRKEAPSINAYTFANTNGPVTVLHVRPDATDYSGTSNNAKYWQNTYKEIRYDLGVKRSFTAGAWTTVTLASKGEIAAESGLHFYTLVSKKIDSRGKATALLLNPVSLDALEAGVPYFVKADKALTDYILDYAYGKPWAEEPLSRNGLYGTYDAKQGLSGMLTLDAEGNLVEDAAECAAYSAYVNLDEVPVEGTLVEGYQTLPLSDEGVWKWFIYDDTNMTASACAPYQGEQPTPQRSGVVTVDADYAPAVLVHGIVEVPATVQRNGNTYNVVSAEPLAFARQIYMTEITLPESLKTIHCVGENIEFTEEHANQGGNGIIIPELAVVYNVAIPNASGLFYDCFALRKVTMSDDITSFGSGAFFGCVNLSELTIPSKLVRISHGAFGACYSLGDELDFTKCENLTEVGYYGFVKSGYPEGKAEIEWLPILKSINGVDLAEYTPEVAKLYEELYSEPNYTFQSLEGKGVKHIKLPASVTDLRYGAFMWGGVLETVTGLEGVYRMGNWVFGYCPALTEVSLTNENLVALPAQTFDECTSLTTVTLPATMQEIKDRAFFRCYELKNITLPTSLQHIGAQAFASSGLESVTLPATLKRISAKAFDGTALDSATSHSAALVAPVLGKEGSGSDLDKVDKDGVSYLYESTKVTELPGEGYYTAPDAFPAYAEGKRHPMTLVDGADDDTYRQAGYDRTFVIADDGILTWQWYIYDDNALTASACAPYEDGNAPEAKHSGVIEVKTDYAPAVYARGAVRVPEKVSYNGKQYTVVSAEPLAFARQVYMTEIELPATLTKVNTVGDSPEFTDEHAAGRGDGIVIPELALLYNVAIPEASGLFYDCFALRKVTFLSDEVTSFGAGAFFGCVNLSELTLPAKLQRISHGAFGACYSLGDTFDLSALTELTEVGYYAFVLSGFPEEGDFAQYVPIQKLLNNTDLTTYQPEVAQLYGDADYTFEGALRGKGLKHIVLPTTVTDIRYAAFQWGGVLETVTGLDNVANLGNWAFGYCRALTEVSLTCEALVALPSHTFAECTSLVKVTLPASLREIKDRAFYKNHALESITLPATLELIGAEAFANSGLQSVQLPAALKRISAKAFNGTPINTVVSASNAAVAPVLGKTGSGSKLDEVDKNGISYLYESTAERLTILPANEGYYSEPDAFPAYEENLRKELTLTAGADDDSYRQAGYGRTFVIADDGILTWQWFIYDETALTASACAPYMEGNAPAPKHDGVVTVEASYKPEVLVEGIVKVPEKVSYNGKQYTVVSAEPLAFARQIYMTEIEFPETLKTIRCVGDYVDFTEEHANQGGNGIIIPELSWIYNVAIPNASGLFYDCFALRKVTMSDDITSFGSGAFFGCVNLEELTIPSKLERISHGAFGACYSLGDELDFTSCSNLTEVGYYGFVKSGYPEGGNEIEWLPIRTDINGVDLTEYDGKLAALYEKLYGETGYTIHSLEGKGVKHIKLPTSVTDLRYGAFMWGGVLETVTGLEGVYRMGNWVFGYCPALTTVSLTNEKLLALPSQTFDECTSLTTVTLPKTMREIKNRAFFRCHELTAITMPESLEHIGAQAFASTGLESVTLPATLKRISAQAFNNTPINTVESAADALDAPVLGKTGSGCDLDVVDTDGVSYLYESTEENLSELPADEAYYEVPDAFPAFAENRRKEMVLKEGADDESYRQAGYERTFIIADEPYTKVIVYFTTEHANTTERWIGYVDDNNEYSNASFKVSNPDADDVINAQTGHLHLGNGATTVFSHEGYTLAAARFYLEGGKSVTVGGNTLTAGRRGYVKHAFNEGDLTFLLAADTHITRIDFYLDIIEEYGDEESEHPNMFPTIVGDYEEEALPVNFIRGDAQGAWSATHIHLTDGETFSLDKEVQAEKVTYSRTFTEADAGIWHSLYLPYAIDDFSGFASEVLSFSQIKLDHSNVLHILGDKVTGSLQANTIYLFKPIADAVMPEVSSTPVKGYDVATLTQSDEHYTVTLTGTYAPKQDLAAQELYAVKGETVTAAVAPAGAPQRASLAYLSDIVKAKQEDILPSFRAYMTLEKKEGAPEPAAIVIEPTDEYSPVGIDTVIVDGDADVYYNLHGQRVSNPVPGIYIRNGEKVVVK